MILTSSVSQRKVSLNLSLDHENKIFLLRVDEVESEGVNSSFFGTSSTKSEKALSQRRDV